MTETATADSSVVAGAGGAQPPSLNDDGAGPGRVSAYHTHTPHPFRTLTP